MNIKLILLGGGGHCKSVIEAISYINNIEIFGILDNKNLNSMVMNIPIIGKDEMLPELVRHQYQFLISLGSIGIPELRIKLFNKLKQSNAKLATIISTTATVSKTSFIEEGSIVMQHAIVNTDVEIGKNCIINTGALVEHESKIGNHVHIATNATINGQCQIGNNCFIGSGSIIGNNVSIPDNTIIGAGSVVIKSIYEQGTYFGNPAKKRNV